MRTLVLALAATAALVAAPHSADAHRARGHTARVAAATTGGMWGMGQAGVPRQWGTASGRTRAAAGRDRGTVVPAPAGCPGRLSCGCIASAHLGLGAVQRGGRALAANWLAYPRASPGPGTAAVFLSRSGHAYHVAAVDAGPHEDGTVTLFDGNSGGGLTRVHRVSTSCCVFVRPSGALEAAQPASHRSVRRARRPRRYARAA